MYKVTINHNGEEIVIHDSNVNDLKLADGTIKTQINAIDNFSFSFLMNNPGFGKIKPLQTLIKVFNQKNQKLEFEGRVLGPNDDMDNTGLHSTSYVCEGELGYLHDSQQRHLEFRGTPRELLETILEYHNTQVEEYKQFNLGYMEVTNSTDNLYLYLSARDDTFETIKEKIIDNIGGELQIRKEDGVRFLDLLERVGTDKDTEIRLAKNLQRMSRNVDPTEIITRLTPLGERIESEDEEATDASQARLTIESVNNGIPYIDDESLISEFGIQGGTMTWNDITLPENLLTRGQQWLSNQKLVLVQFKISALDLSLIGLDFDAIESGNTYPVINTVMGVNERLRVIGKQVSINNPQNAALTIGDKFKTLNQYQNEINKRSQMVVDLENRVSRQSQTISTLKNELTEVDNAVQQVKFELEEGDLPALEDAIDNLNQAVDNLIEAIDDIPVYELVTHESDGLMSAADKEFLDSIDLVTHVIDGLMRAVDKIKLDYITVTEPTDLDEIREKTYKITVQNPVDLDDIISRLEALENGSEEPEVE